MLVAHVSARGGQVVGTAGSCSGWWLGEVGNQGMSNPVRTALAFFGDTLLEVTVVCGITFAVLTG